MTGGRRGHGSPAARIALGPQEVVIRDYRPTDRPRVERWLRLLQLQLAGMEPRLLTRKLGPGYGREYVRRTLQLLGKQGGFLLIAELRGVPRGFLSGTVQPIGGTMIQFEEHPNLQGFVLDLFVEEEARGQKIGHWLMEAAERRFHDAGCDNLQLFVAAGNRDAQAFYARRGFRTRDQRLFKLIATQPRSWGEATARRREGVRDLPIGGEAPRRRPRSSG